MTYTDVLVYVLLALALYLGLFVTREVVYAVLRLEHRDAQDAREASSRERG